jgi:CBS domain-containing protein
MPQRKKLSDVLNSRKFVSMPADATAATAARTMLERRVGAILVIEAGQLRGIVTERDINFRVVAIGRDPQLTSLSDIMTRAPKTLTPETPVIDALNIMEKHGYRHVPVEKDGQVVGIVSLRDIFLEVKRALEQDIQESDQFIVGSTTEPAEGGSGTTH